MVSARWKKPTVGQLGFFLFSRQSSVQNRPQSREDRKVQNFNRGSLSVPSFIPISSEPLSSPLSSSLQVLSYDRRFRHSEFLTMDARHGGGGVGIEELRRRRNRACRTVMMMLVFCMVVDGIVILMLLAFDPNVQSMVAPNSVNKTAAAARLIQRMNDHHR